MGFMGGVSPKGLAHNPLSWSDKGSHSSVNNIQEKMGLEMVSVRKHCVLLKEPACFHGGGGITGLLILVCLPLL